MAAMVWIRSQIDAASIAERHPRSTVASASLAVLIMETGLRLAAAAMERIVRQVDARSAAYRQRPFATATCAPARRRARGRSVGRARGAGRRAVAAFSTVPEEVYVAVCAASQPSGSDREHARRSEPPKLTSRHASGSMEHHAPPMVPRGRPEQARRRYDCDPDSRRGFDRISTWTMWS